MQPPAFIGRYRVEAVLGRGAMGVVFRAHDPLIDRKVAIKLVRADLLEGEDRADYVRRFQQEAQAAGRCSHPNIVAVYDLALHEGNPYLAMEFVDGVPLSQVTGARGRFGVAEAAALARQVLDGLAAAHALGVVHRDIKPANIMLTGGGRAKVTDFGISRLDSAALTGAGAVVGTPSYMSPEQCRGEAVDARSDLFSVAVLLHELLAGAKPFAGRTSHEVWHRILTEAPTDLAALRPDVPAPLLAILRRGLAKRAEDRFPSAAAMAGALAALAPAGAAPEPDRTVMAIRQSPAAPPPDAPAALDSSTLGSIERRLARYVGPIAGLLVKSAVREAETLESLCATLAGAIADPAGRHSFRRELEGELAGSAVRSRMPTQAGALLPEATLLRAQAELARYAGPVARVLVRRAAPGCADQEQLWQRLAQHIDDPAQRAAFLKKL